MNDGRPARFRLAQTVAWSAVVGACAAAFVAGVYFNVLEVNWHLFWLKGWWDSLVASPSWEFYRHGYRNEGEPELAYLIVGTLIAKRKTWTRRAPWWYMLAAPLLLVAVSAAGITGAIWLLDFGIPGWAGGPLNHLVLAAGTVAAGFVLGHIVKPVWAPVGATLNGWLVDRSVDRYCIRRADLPGLRPPAWVRHWYLAPLPTRERWVWQMEHNVTVTARRDAPGWVTALAGVGLLLVAYLTVTGFIAHFWIGSGHSFPFLAP